MSQVMALSCGHELSVSKSELPEPGVLVWCGLCAKMVHRPFPLRADADGFPVLREWGWKCVSCPATRQFGADQSAAVRAGTKHYRQNPSHEIWLISPIGCVEGRWNYQGERFV